jgi:glycosyltransferase involved in cell wall biosynthesis
MIGLCAADATIGSGRFRCVWTAPTDLLHIPVSTVHGLLMRTRSRCQIPKCAALDVSLVLALHREGALLQRTLLSLREATHYARARGIRVELVATLDRPNELTRQVLREFATDKLDEWTVLEVDHGSLGPTRNRGIRAARGRFIYTCDGDDLISFNSIAAMFRLAETAGPDHIIFHQYVCAFGEYYASWKRFPLDIVTPLVFLEQHPYSSAAFAHRAIFEAVPYTDSGITSGYAFEDWHFNAECVGRGYQILVAEDTIYFYRQRRGSLIDQANRNTTRQILPCTLFEPQTWVRITSDAYERLGPLEGARPSGADGVGGSHMQGAAPYLTFIHAANAIDPDIDPLILGESTLRSNPGGGSALTVGLAYHEICQIIRAQRFDEVFLLPFIANSGADRYVRDVMQVLYDDLRKTTRILVLLGEPLVGGSYLDRVPPNATVIDLGNDWPQLTMEQRQLIALKLIQSTAPRARLHLRQGPFAEGFYRSFKTILRSNSVVYYRFGDLIKVDPAAFARPWSFNFVAEHAHDLTLIIASSETIIARDRQRIAVCPEKWRWLPTRYPSSLTEAEAVARAITRKGRVLWASQDLEKHPELLPHIAKKLKQLGSDLRIDVFDSAAQEIFGLNCLYGPRNAPYWDSCDSLFDHSAYDALVYPAAFDGMPNVVLDAMAAGVPVIAPDVGIIGEIIVDGDSGLLLPTLTNDDEIAAVYATAIIRLTTDPALCAKLAAGALRRLVDRHSRVAFAEAAHAIFGSLKWTLQAASTLDSARNPSPSRRMGMTAPRRKLQQHETTGWVGAR